MNGSQLMGLDSVGIDIDDIHGYLCKLTVGQRTPGFWGATPHPFAGEVLLSFLLLLCFL